MQLERLSSGERLHRELEGLANLRTLRSLTLYVVPVSDTDVDALGRLTQLTRLRVYGADPALTREGLERLKKALPNCEIEAETIGSESPSVGANGHAEGEDADLVDDAALHREVALWALGAKAEWIEIEGRSGWV